ncbi:MAG: DUF2277 domain-containing protein [Nitriliruptoraceae bacterium]
MCRSIHQLRGTEPAPTDTDIEDASRQFVRKISGYRTPSAANRVVFDRAVDDIAAATRALLDDLVTRPVHRPRAS